MKKTEAIRGEASASGEETRNGKSSDWRRLIVHGAGLNHAGPPDTGPLDNERLPDAPLVEESLSEFEERVADDGVVGVEGKNRLGLTIVSA